MKTGQKRIVIASILKPVDDTRMFAKMAMSLAETERYEVTVIGYTAALPESSPVHFIALPPFKRLSFRRWFASLQVLQKIRKVKPEVLIINTHELLIVGIINRILFGTPLVYDVQENYYRNLVHTNAFPPVLKNLLALWVRLKEKLTAPFIKWFFLAEKGYQHEMTFFRKRYTVLENKAIVPEGYQKPARHDKQLRLLFSGTLAESTGVFEAIELTRSLHAANAKITLKIIGYSAQPKVLNRIKEAIASAPFIQLQGGDVLVPHEQIRDAIMEADFGFIYYTPSLHTQNSIPTKLYEYLAFHLPILLQDYRPWIELCLPLNAAICVAYRKPDLHEILTKMEEGGFYVNPPENVTWQQEAVKLVRITDQLIKLKK